MRQPRSTRWPRALALLGVSAIPFVSTAFQAQDAQPVQLTAQEDLKRQMDVLHIAELRRGANGSNKEAPNYANYDESKANPYPNLPDPLMLKNGKKVTTAKIWWDKRRPEIVEDFDREIYGRVPKVTPKVRWEVTETTNEKNGDVPVVVKKLVGHVDNSSYPQVTVDIQMTMGRRLNAAGPVPVVMEFGFTAVSGPRRCASTRGRTSGRPPGPPIPTGPTWQQQVLAKGWGYAVDRTQQHPGGQRRGIDAGHHRPGEQRPASQSWTIGARCGRGPGARAALSIISRLTRP